MVESCWNIVWLVRMTGWPSRNKMYLAYPVVLIDDKVFSSDCSNPGLSSKSVLRRPKQTLFPYNNLVIADYNTAFGRHF